MNETRPLVYCVNCTLDGFIAGPGGEVDFFPMSADLVAYLAAETPETLPTQMHPALNIDNTNWRFDTVVMGRGTYEPALKQGVTSPFGHLRQYVVTRSITTSPDPDVRLIADDPVSAIRALKAEDGLAIWLAGGGKLASTLLTEIDELIIRTLPVVAGAGVPLFDGPFNPTEFTLTASTLLDGAAAILQYTR